VNPARRRALSFLPSLFPYAGLAVWGFLRSARAEEERRTFIEIPPQATDDAERIEVREFFYYGCGACYAFEPYLREWEENKAKDVLLVRTPALRTTRWIPLTKVYLVLLKLGAHLRLHQEVFDAYHFDNIDLGDGPVFADWAVSKGLEREAVQRWWDSKEIAAALEVTHSVTRRYYVQSVPTLIIDGRYLTSPALAGGQKETITVIEELIDRRRRERPPSST
jgi:protein dithiol oxidoreductase (disulfide-forming)